MPRILPMHPDPIAESIRLAEAAIAAFETRMREVIPAYRQGDRVDLHGEEFEVSSYQREGMPVYWLKGNREELFWPVDLERVLCPGPRRQPRPNGRTAPAPERG